jgi:hypothetical protein
MAGNRDQQRRFDIEDASTDSVASEKSSISPATGSGLQ